MSLIKYNWKFNMSEAIVRAKKIGGSLVVTIPKKIVDLDKIEPNELVKIDIFKIKKDGFGMLKEVLNDKEKLKILREKIKISKYD